jgi:hypothetical protein
MLQIYTLTYLLSSTFNFDLTCERNSIAELHSDSRLWHVHFQLNHERASQLDLIHLTFMHYVEEMLLILINYYFKTTVPNLLLFLFGTCHLFSEIKRTHKAKFLASYEK